MICNEKRHHIICYFRFRTIYIYIYTYIHTRTHARTRTHKHIHAHNVQETEICRNPHTSSNCFRISRQYGLFTKTLSVKVYNKNLLAG
jgi:hypothetical protein